jgi:hypothetical protein
MVLDHEIQGWETGADEADGDFESPETVRYV